MFLTPGTVNPEEQLYPGQVNESFFSLFFNLEKKREGMIKK
jgi:hypothetical protein